MSKRLILILGGARSGKSAFAERLAEEQGGAVLFVATATAEDEEMQQRITKHKQSRPPGWRTLEVPVGIAENLQQERYKAQVVLIDCLTLLTANLLLENTNNTLAAEKRLESEIEALLQYYDQNEATLIIVSNEVGMGLIPPYPLGRVYRDLLGRANHILAKRADEVYLMVAGLPLPVKMLSRD
ncbi:MAG: bifunctional adenosylcobinamide kinase/adenosylcobinamide-phosphate guanylyltransferase [Chloroflexi bacterium]|nr:bifunctional adenosylcobinamide kinase/adenosylcobinamide-phosphate guanylyltransferase [Chloroflexota bacterium]